MTLLSHRPDDPQVAAASGAPAVEAAAAPAVGTSAADRRDESVGRLAAQLGEQVSRLVRDELALAQVEAKQRAKKIGVGAGLFGAAGGMVFFGGACFVTAAVLGLCNVVQPWFAAIIVGVALLLLAGLTVLPGWKGVTAKTPAVPADTIRSVKEDVAAVRSAVQHDTPNGRHAAVRR